MSEPGDSLVDFIRAAKQQGAGDAFVVDLLRSRGWSEKKVLNAFAAYYETETGMGVPSRGGGIEAARDAFLHLLSFIALGTWTTALGSLFYTLIDRWFPLVSASFNTQNIDRYAISIEMAGIFVAFPLYLAIMRSMTRAAEANPERLQSAVRKWLTYIALLVAAAIVIGDLVTFLAYFLRGDLTVRFALQVLTLLVLAGGVLSYYLATLRDEAPPRAHNQAYAGVATLLVVAGLALGFLQIGSRATNQARTRDDRRLADLTEIARQIYVQQARTNPRESFQLPQSQADLAARFSVAAQRTDPQTGRRYEYIKQDPTHYLLCAEFEAPTPSDWQLDPMWHHAAGHACIAFDTTRMDAYFPQAEH
jgi:hypothetical protein